MSDKKEGETSVVDGKEYEHTRGGSDIYKHESGAVVEKAGKGLPPCDDTKAQKK